jgi:hypothetical protein
MMMSRGISKRWCTKSVYVSHAVRTSGFPTLAGLVHDNCSERSLQETEDVSIGAEWFAVLAIRLRRAAIQASQVELRSVGGNLMCDADASGFVKFAEILAALCMIGKGVPVPVQVSSCVANRGSVSG